MPSVEVDTMLYSQSPPPTADDTALGGLARDLGVRADQRPPRRRHQCRRFHSARFNHRFGGGQPRPSNPRRTAIDWQAHDPYPYPLLHRRFSSASAPRSARQSDGDARVREILIAAGSGGRACCCPCRRRGRRRPRCEAMAIRRRSWRRWHPRSMPCGAASTSSPSKQDQMAPQHRGAAGCRRTRPGRRLLSAVPTARGDRRPHRQAAAVRSRRSRRKPRSTPRLPPPARIAVLALTAQHAKMDLIAAPPGRARVDAARFAAIYAA